MRQRPPQQLPARRRRARDVSHRLAEFVIGRRRQQYMSQIDTGDPVHHAVVDLADHGEAISFEPLHDPVLPERPRPVQLPCHYPCG